MFLIKRKRNESNIFLKIVLVGARGSRMKLKGRSIGSRTEEEVERLQHRRGSATSHGLKEGSHPRKRRNESWYSVVF